MKSLLAVALLVTLVAVGYSAYICSEAHKHAWCFSSDADDPITPRGTLDRCCRKLQQCEHQCTTDPICVWHCVCAKRFCHCLDKLDNTTDVATCRSVFFGNEGHACFRWSKKPRSCDDRDKTFKSTC